MRVNYINVNGRLVNDREAVFTTENRAFRYGDGLFETMLWKGGKIRFLDKHIARLRSGMQLLKLEGDGQFSEPFLLGLVRELIQKNELADPYIRVRLQVYRDGAGLYSPVQNKSAYVLSVESLNTAWYEASDARKSGLIMGLYTEQIKAFSGLSHLKSVNAQIYVLAGLYRKQQGLDEVVILNQDGLVCETTSSNIFVSYNGKIYTPALSEGCVDGVARKVILQAAPTLGVEVIEAKIDPLLLAEADEIFLTNAVRGVQWVMGYKQKRYFNKWSKQFQQFLEFSV